MSEQNFEGHEPRECGEHRTVGPHRAWCYADTEWCYPASPCRGCELAMIRARPGELDTGDYRYAYGSPVFGVPESVREEILALCLALDVARQGVASHNLDSICHQENANRWRETAVGLRRRAEAAEAAIARVRVWCDQLDAEPIRAYLIASKFCPPTSICAVPTGDLRRALDAPS